MMKTSRREFISTLATASAAAAFLPLSAVAAKTSSKRVIVIGAGVSGLHSANILERNGFTVEILEASERFGGKIMGRMVGKHRFDMGGQAFSAEMSRVRALGKRFGLNTIPRPKQTDFFFTDGKMISGVEFEPMQAEMANLTKKAVELFPKLDVESERAKLHASSVSDWAKPFLPTAEPFFRSLFCAEWCAEPADVSLLHYLDLVRAYTDDEGEMDFRFREGFIGMVEALRKDTKSPLRLNTPVDRIEVTPTGVNVFSGEKKFSADYLVVATPLPQLKDVKITGIDTGRLTSSLATFRGAAVKKAIALYKKPFWGTGAREGTFSAPLGLSVMDNSDEQAGVYSLAIFLGGPSASARVGKGEILSKLTAAFGKEAGEPLAYEEQEWLGSKFMTGGYAANRIPGIEGSGVVPKSLGERIHLAGSDAADEYGSYVEGALAAAERATGAILKSKLHVTAQRRSLWEMLFS